MLTNKLDLELREPRIHFRRDGRPSSTRLQSRTTSTQYLNGEFLY